MFKTILLTIFLFFGFTTKVYGDTGEWQIVLQGQLQEPGLDKLIEWVPEEVPRTVTFYFDTDSDGIPDDCEEVYNEAIADYQSQIVEYQSQIIEYQNQILDYQLQIEALQFLIIGK